MSREQEALERINEVVQELLSNHLGSLESLESARAITDLEDIVDNLQNILTDCDRQARQQSSEG